LSQAKRIFTSRYETYQIISEIYKLPDYSSKAISKSYLKVCLQKPCHIFRIDNKDFHAHFVVVKHITAQEILGIIETCLKSKGLLPTGLNSITLPNIEWLISVYFFFLFPNDEKNYLSKKNPRSKL